MLSSAPPRTLRSCDHAGKLGCALPCVLLKHRIGRAELLKHASRLAQVTLNIGRAQFRHRASPHFLSIIHYITYTRARTRGYGDL